MSTEARTILVATDADNVLGDVDAALTTPNTTLLRVRSGKAVVPAAVEHDPDLIVLDLQTGNMGGVATALEIRNEESFGRVQPQKVLMLLDRVADVFLARRAEADGWLIKPLNAIRLRKAADAVLAGGSYTEGDDGSLSPSDDLDVPLADDLAVTEDDTTGDGASGDEDDVEVTVPAE